MSVKNIESVSLFFKDGASDKEYNIFLVENDTKYFVNFSYGRRGNAINTGSKIGYTTYDNAKTVYDKLVREKTGKGYKPVATIKTGISSPVTTQSELKSTSLIPQLLNPIDSSELDKYIQSDNFLMQEKLDGKRIMIAIKDNDVICSNRKGIECGIPNEIINDLKGFAENLILDGELIGAIYHVFDLLEYKNEDYRGKSCIERFNLLRLLFLSSNLKHIKIVQNALTKLEKQNLYTQLLNKEGVVFKHKDSPYVSGRPNSGGNQLKYKNWSSCTALVLNVNNKRSVEIAVASSPSVVSVGNVMIPANYDIPNVGDLVEVKYLYYYLGGALYQPQFLGKRDDVEVDTLASLKVKSNSDD